MNTPDYEIHPLPLPTPFPVGDVNCYLLRADRWVLIDTGLEWAKDRAALLAGLEKAGARVEDISEVLLTHAHIDHCGQAGWIQEVSGAPVRAHPADAPRVTGFPATTHEMIARYREHSGKMGFPIDVYDTMMTMLGKGLMLARAARIERTIDAGDRIPLGGVELEVHHTPGHTPGSVCFYDRRNRVLFAGDTVLKRVTPNPFFGGHLHRHTMGTASYLRSLEKLLALDVAVCHCGHGEPVENLPEAVARVRTHSRARSEKILTLMGDAPHTAFEISGKLFGELALIDLWLAFAETLGHLEALEDEGRVRCVEEGTVARFVVDGRVLGS